MSETDSRDAFDEWLQVLIKKPWKARKLDAVFPEDPDFVLRLRQALEAAGPDDARPLVTGRPRRGAAGELGRPPRDTVVGCRVDGTELEAIDLLVEAGVRPSRSDAAAWFIRQGIEGNAVLLEEVRETVGEIRRLREQAQRRAREREGPAAADGGAPGGTAAPPPPDAPQAPEDPETHP